MNILLEMLLVSFSVFLSIAVFCWMVDAIRRSNQ